MYVCAEVYACVRGARAYTCAYDNVRVRIHLCVYLCAYACTCDCERACVGLRVRVCARLRVPTRVLACARVRVRMCVPDRVHVLECVRACVCTQVRA